MSCQKYKDKLPLLAIGDLPTVKVEEVRAHIKDCVVCRAEYEGYVEIVGMYEEERVTKLAAFEKLELEKDIYKSMLFQRLQKSKGIARSVFNAPLIRIAAGIIIFFAGITAQSFISQFEEPQLITVAKQAKAFAATEYNKAPLAGLRFSSQGLKAIAQGKSAVEITP